MYELWVTIPDHTKTAREIQEGALREEFIFESDIDVISNYVKSDRFDSMYGDFTEIRIVRKGA